MQIRAATLNTWALPEPLGRQVAGRMQAIGEELPRLAADVVAFEEVWSSDARRQLVRAGRAAGLAHAWPSETSPGSGGLLVLARWPLDDARFERFSLPQLPPRPDHPDYYVSKGFVSLRLNASGSPLRIVATHLQARYGRDVRHEYRAVRVGQVIELASALQHVREPVLVLGDFNFKETHDEYRILRGLTRVRDAAVEVDRRQSTVDASNPFREPQRVAKRVDYIFLRDGARAGLRVLDVRRTFDAVFELGGHPASFSDHAGVVAEIELNDAPRSVAAPSHEASRLAAALLTEGRVRAQRERAHARLVAGAGWAGALIATAGGRNRHLTRRRLLRTGVRVAGLAALTPGVGYTLLAEVFAPEQLQAYDQLADRLAAVADDPALFIA